jgi:hypothetical protein
MLKCRRIVGLLISDSFLLVIAQCDNRLQVCDKQSVATCLHSCVFAAETFFAVAGTETQRVLQAGY